MASLVLQAEAESSPWAGIYQVIPDRSSKGMPGIWQAYMARKCIIHASSAWMTFSNRRVYPKDEIIAKKPPSLSGIVLESADQLVPSAALLPKE